MVVIYGHSNCLLVSKNLIFNSETVVKSAKCVAVSQVHYNATTQDFEQI